MFTEGYCCCCWLPDTETSRPFLSWGGGGGGGGSVDPKNMKLGPEGGGDKLEAANKVSGSLPVDRDLLCPALRSNEVTEGTRWTRGPKVPGPKCPPQQPADR